MMTTDDQHHQTPATRAARAYTGEAPSGLLNASIEAAFQPTTSNTNGHNGSALKDPRLDDLIKDLIAPVIGSKDDQLRADVEDVVLAIANAVVMGQTQHLDLITERVIGPRDNIDLARLTVAVDLLTGYCLQTLPGGPATVLDALPTASDDGAPQWATAREACGSILVGKIIGDLDRAAQGNGLIRADSDVAWFAVQIFSHALARVWSAQARLWQASDEAYTRVIKG